MSCLYKSWKSKPLHLKLSLRLPHAAASSIVTRWISSDWLLAPSRSPTCLGQQFSDLWHTTRTLRDSGLFGKSPAACYLTEAPARSRSWPAPPASLKIPYAVINLVMNMQNASFSSSWWRGGRWAFHRLFCTALLRRHQMLGNTSFNDNTFWRPSP